MATLHIFDNSVVRLTEGPVNDHDSREPCLLSGLPSGQEPGRLEQQPTPISPISSWKFHRCGGEP